MPSSLTSGSSIIVSVQNTNVDVGLRYGPKSSALPIVPQSVSRGARFWRLRWFATATACQVASPEERIRDLALFNVAIDSKLCGCDVVALKVEDVAPNGYAFGYSPGLLPAALTYASIACRVCSVNSKLTGCPVYFCCPLYF